MREHRIVPGFLVQTGDKTGTGGGGESFYGGGYADMDVPQVVLILLCLHRTI